MTDQRLLIRKFIAKHVGGTAFTDEQDLFASGHVNSLFAVQIVMFVENTMGVPVVGDDLDIENFSSVDRIDRYVARRRAAIGASAS